MRALRVGHRFLLTGTPLMNNLIELWALVDFATRGTLLGPEAPFRHTVQEPIARGMHRDASPETRARGEAATLLLQETIAPCFLRREKAGLSPAAASPHARMLAARALKHPSSRSANASAFASRQAVHCHASDAHAARGRPAGEWEGREKEGTYSRAHGRMACSRMWRFVQAPLDPTVSSRTRPAIALPPPLHRGRPYRVVSAACWLPLSDAQRHLYAAFLRSATVARALNESAYPLAAITVLKKICTHPWLLRKYVRTALLSGPVPPSDPPPFPPTALHLIVLGSGDVSQNTKARTHLSPLTSSCPEQCPHSGPGTCGCLQAAPNPYT